MPVKELYQNTYMGFSSLIIWTFILFLCNPKQKNK